MKILHILGQVNLPHNPDSEACSGVVWNTLQLAAAQCRRGHDVTVCAPARNPWKDTWQLVNLVGLPAREWAFARIGPMTLDLREPLTNMLYARTQKFDVVHAHHQDYVRGLKSPVRIIHADSDPLYRTSDVLPRIVHRANFRTINRTAHAIIAVSLYIASRYRSAYRFTIPIHMVSNGVDSTQFHPSFSIEEGVYWRQQWRALPNSPVFLYCGALIEEKGVRELAQAFVQLLRNIPHAHLVIVGSAKLWAQGQWWRTQQYQSDLYRLAAAQAPTNIHFIDSVGHNLLPSIYGAADVVVLPSTGPEASPLVILEAFASKKPVIASNIGGIPELMAGVGTLVPPADVDALYTAMKQHAQDQQLRERQGARGRQVSLRKSWDVMEQGVAEVYRQLGAKAYGSARKRTPSHTQMPPTAKGPSL